MAKRFLISLMLVLSLAQANVSYGSEIPTTKQQAPVMATQTKSYPDEVHRLKDKIVKLKQTDKYRYRLEYKSEEDLLETLNEIYKHTKGEPNFDAYKVTAIAIKESKLNHRALNPVDGGKGLMMAMPRYWKDQLPWYKNPYNKKQSICAGVSVLRIIKAEKGCSTWETIRRYNTAGPKSIPYVRDVREIYKDIRKA